MSERLRECIHDLAFVAKLKPKTRKIVLKELKDKKYYYALKEIARNTIKKNVDISKVKLNKKDKKNIINIACNKAKSKRKRLIVQSGGWISWIIPLVFTLLKNGLQ